MFFRVNRANLLAQTRKRRAHDFEEVIHLRLCGLRRPVKLTQQLDQFQDDTAEPLGVVCLDSFHGSKIVRLGAVKGLLIVGQRSRHAMKVVDPVGKSADFCGDFALSRKQFRGQDAVFVSVRRMLYLRANAVELRIRQQIGMHGVNRCQSSNRAAGVHLVAFCGRLRGSPGHFLDMFLESPAPFDEMFQLVSIVLRIVGGTERRVMRPDAFQLLQCSTGLGLVKVRHRVVELALHDGQQ